MMLTTFIFSFSAIAAIIPAALLPYRRKPARDRTFWLFLIVAIAGPMAWIFFSTGETWQTGFSPALWVSVISSLILFGLLSALMQNVWRLAPLVYPYMAFIGCLATVWLQPSETPTRELSLSFWLYFHIIVSVFTYGLLTIAALSGLAVILQERALKKKRPNRLTSILPSVADGESIQVALLSASAVILGFGLLSGMAAQYLETGQFIELKHKIALSFLTFITIVLLLAVHVRTGIRGRRAARYVLLSYLLITLAYPGAKFVLEIVLI
jgi:ABC-type uncharacterized transport system permease subunit